MHHYRIAYNRFFNLKSDRKSTRLNSSHIEDLSLHDALPICQEKEGIDDDQILNHRRGCKCTIIESHTIVFLI